MTIHLNAAKAILISLNLFYQNGKLERMKYFSNIILFLKNAKTACFIILLVVVLKSLVLTLALTKDPKYNSIFFLMTQDHGHENVVILCCIITSSLSPPHSFLCPLDVSCESISGNSCPIMLLAGPLLFCSSSPSFCSADNPSKRVCYQATGLQCSKL